MAPHHETASLVVHEGSVPYLRNVLVALVEALGETFGQECRQIICSSVDTVDTADAEFVFVIGENFDRFRRRAGRRYVYLNFSVVTLLGNPFQCSLKGIRSILHKKRLLRAKLDLFDALLDYYPSQTRYLERVLNIPVAGFVPWVRPPSEEPIAVTDRPYDVCFVGAMSTRRRRVLDQLRAAGCILAPSSNVVAENVAALSRCTLNIHVHRSNHFEIPRVIGALPVSPLITEDSYGIGEILPQGLVRTVPYRKLAENALASLANSEDLEDTASRARDWYNEVGAPRFKAMFVSSATDIRHRLRSPS